MTARISSEVCKKVTIVYKFFSNTSLLYMNLTLQLFISAERDCYEPIERLNNCSFMQLSCFRGIIEYFITMKCRFIQIIIKLATLG